MKRNRAAQKKAERKKFRELDDGIQKRRAAIRERVKKCREKAKLDITQNENQKEKNQNLSEVVAESYSCSQTLGKAVKKVSQALPASPRKQRAILAHIVSNLNDKDKETVVNVVAKSIFKRNPVASSQLVNDVRKFYERDDISRSSPNSRDVKKYKCTETGEESFLPTRHMILSIKEAHALFVENRKREDLGMENLVFQIYESFLFFSISQYVFFIFFISFLDTCCLSLFKKYRPENVKPINDLPHNTCMCAYHANFMEAVAALNEAVPSVPGYDDGFVRQFLCQDSSMDCWYGKCAECNGISVDKLKDAVGETQLSPQISWMIWKKNKKTNRVEKEKENGKVTDLVAYIASISPQFLRHT